MPPLIEAEDLAKDYRLGLTAERVFDGLNLQIQPADFVALTGPSGSGKSTLLHLIGLMDKPTRGRIRFGTCDTSRASEDELDALRRRSMGFIFQNFNLFSSLTVYENVGFALLGLENSRQGAHERILQALRSVGMDEHLKKFPRQLSGGQRQRVAIARAVVHRPQIVFADEPTASLDREHAKEVMSLLKDLRQKLEVAIVFASHDSEIYAQARRVLRMGRNSLVEASV